MTHYGYNVINGLTDGDSSAVLEQFNQLMDELMNGTLRRNLFEPWEIGILVDIVSCGLRNSPRRDRILREYQMAVVRHIRQGGLTPLKFSDYLMSIGDNPGDGRSFRAHGQ